MRIGPKAATVALFCVAICSRGWAQQVPSGQTRNNSAKVSHHARPHKSTLTKDDRASLLAVALDAKRLRYSEHDCSHLVHAIYKRAGFPYSYADSEDLYTGVEGFQRAARPQPGDLVVWHGHVGIVIRPSQHAFYSFLSRGPAIDNYRSRYWKARGQPRFYRYLKSDSCAGCALARSQPE